MAVTASQIADPVKLLLREARRKLIVAILKHTDRAELKKIIEEVQRLGGKESLSQPWSKEAGDVCDEARPPIVVSAHAHHLEAMRLLLNANVDLNFESRRGIPIFTMVCETGDEQAAAMLLRKGASVHTEDAYDRQPLHPAFFASLKFNYSVVFHSDWGSSTLKQNIIAWWKGGEFTPSRPLKAQWPGAIPLVALLLEHGANPAVKLSCGLSPSIVVQNPSCVLKSAETRALVELSTVKIDSSRKSDPRKEADDILTFRITLKDRGGKRTLEIMVDVDYNMELPRDVDAGISSEICEILATKKTRTMRGLIEAYAPKDKPQLQSDGLADMKKRMEQVEVHTAAHAALAARSAGDVKEMREKFSVLHDQHIVMHKKHLDEETYAARIAAIEAGRKTGSAQYKFYDTVAKELIRVFDTCKLHMRNPDKLNKGALAAKGVEAAANLIAQQLADAIGPLSDFIPPPFSVVGKVAGFLVKSYSDYKLKKENHRVVDLLPITHEEMCKDLALELAENYADALKDMKPEDAEKLAKNAVGIMFALMCDPKKTIDPRHSFDEIETALFKAVTTSDFFQEKLGEYSKPVTPGATPKAPAKSRSWFPSFGKKKEKDSIEPVAGSEPAKFEPPTPARDPAMLLLSRSKSPSPPSSTSSTPEKDSDKRQGTPPSPILKPRPPGAGDQLIIVS